MRASNSEVGRVSIMIEGEIRDSKRLNNFGISSISESSWQMMADVKKKIRIRIALAKKASIKRNELLAKLFNRRVKNKLIKTLA